MHSVRLSREVYKGALDFSLDGTSESVAYTTNGSIHCCQKPVQLYNNIQATRDRDRIFARELYNPNIQVLGFRVQILGIDMANGLN